MSFPIRIHNQDSYVFSVLHWGWSQRGAPGSPELCDVCLTKLGALLRLLKVLLCLPVLGQVNGGNLLCILNLFLVRLYLLLELVNQVGDTVLVLLVLLLLEQQLLDLSLTFGDSLVHLVRLLNCLVQLNLKVTNLCIQLGRDLSGAAGNLK